MILKNDKVAKKKEPIIYDGINFDSNEEMYAYWYFLELKSKGFISEIITHPKSFELSDKFEGEYIVPMKKVADKVLKYTIVQPHIYTADIQIQWTEKALGLFVYVFPTTVAVNDKNTFNLFSCNNELISYFEVKPIFDQNNMTRCAKVNIKWVLTKYNELINLFIPEIAFNSTFTPQRFLFQNKAKGTRNIKYKKIITLNDFLE